MKERFLIKDNGGTHVVSLEKYDGTLKQLKEFGLPYVVEIRNEKRTLIILERNGNGKWMIITHDK